jgi:hypothetical protein
MPITRSDVALFSTGIAVGVVAAATYPKWKDKVAPLLSAVMAGAAAAYQDASSQFAQAGDGATVVEPAATAASEPHAARNGAVKVETLCA